MEDPTALTIDILGTKYITQRGKRKIRDILLQYGEPLQEKKLIDALAPFGFDKKSIKNWIKELKAENLIQKGNRGLRAL